MKNIYSYSILFFSIFIISCDDYLSENPPTFISSDNFYKNETQVRSAADAVYEPLDDRTSTTSIYGYYWPMMDLGTDDVSAKINTNINISWLDHTVSPSDIWFTDRGQYTKWFVGIARANNVIDRLPGAVMDATKKIQIEGEVRALRALYYMHLLKTYGDMPIMNKAIKVEDEIYQPRSSVDAVYNQIVIPDLKFAEENCVDGLHHGYITKWSAKIMLADVYLTRAGWRRNARDGKFVKGGFKEDGSSDGVDYNALARDKAKEIIDFSPHSLITTPLVNGQAVTPACGVPWDEKKPFSVETMFEIATVALDGLGSRLSRNCGVEADGRYYWGNDGNSQPLLSEGINLKISELKFLGPGPSYSGVLNLGTYIPTPNLYREFEAGDQRRDFNILTRYKSSDGKIYLTNPTFRKYVDMAYYLGEANTSPFRTNTNFVLYRFAEALLIYAEAANEAENGPSALAYDAINKIRRRAFAVTDNSKDLSGLTQEQFRKAVWKERRCEFVAEVKRRFDLIRTNRLFTETNPTVPGKMDRTWYASDGNKSTVAIPRLAAAHGSVPFPDREWLMPIPTQQLELNKPAKWYQNFGY